MEDPDELIRIIEGFVAAAIIVRSPILQIHFSIDNFTIAFDAYKVGMYQLIMRRYILLQEIPDELLVQRA